MRTIMARFFQRQESGHVALWFALSVVLVFVCLGLVVDFGFAYITRAQLSKAVDAATLMGVRNLYQGDSTAINIARQTFSANYPQTGRDVSIPTANAGVQLDGVGRRVFTVSATTRINTLFLRAVPQWKTLTVAANAEGIRSRAVVALVLDKSGSMQTANKWRELGPSVDVFISMFSDQLDKMSLTLYSTIANTPVTLRQPFKTIISNNVPRAKSTFAGATFMSDGLTNGWTEINREPVAPNETVVRAAVFFTDGKANVIRVDNVRCKPVEPNRNYLFGGQDDTDTAYRVYSLDGTPKCERDYPPRCCDERGIRDGFPQIYGGKQYNVRMDKIRDEAEDRTMSLADQMRAQGIIIYVIGLGSGGQINETWLLKLANDPRSPSTFNPNLIAGKAVFPKTADELRDAFQFVAADIVGRLTR